MANKKHFLKDGQEVGIIGGGPAGAFSAIMLLEEAAKKGLHLKVTVFEQRKPASPGGPRSCKGCSGVLSYNAIKNMAGLGLRIPETVIQCMLDTYRIQIMDRKMQIFSPDDAPIYSVFRGAGPHGCQEGSVISFDAFLRNEVKKRGGTFIYKRVVKIKFSSKPTVVTRSSAYSYDFMILACGVNSKYPAFKPQLFSPPRTDHMKLNATELPAEIHKNEAIVKFNYPDHILFGASVPKDQYMNTSYLEKKIAKGKISKYNFMEGDQDFYRYNGRAPLCYCVSYINVGAAASYFGDKWAAVGDMAVTRLYKDGIGTALLLARQLVRTALEHGISGKNFKRYYAPLCKKIERDNIIGKLLFRFYSLFLKSAKFTSGFVHLLNLEKKENEKPLNNALWGMVTGSYSYYKICRFIFKIKNIRRMLKYVILGK
ncbi:MAG TPA: hypothetical protein VKS21_01410 [Spirochaetota bacterium]|nr:hypothetical protein [Spirochaetota bacterium]